MIDDVFINELAALANGDVDLNVYASDIINMFKETIQRNYIDKFNLAIEEYKKKSVNENNRELNLLQAMKEFTNNENQKKQFDMMADVYKNINAVGYLMNDISEKKATLNKKQEQNNKNPFIKDDGIYEIDDTSGKLNIGIDGFLPLVLLLMNYKK